MGGVSTDGTPLPVLTGAHTFTQPLLWLCWPSLGTGQGAGGAAWMRRTMCSGQSPSRMLPFFPGSHGASSRAPGVPLVRFGHT